MKNYCLLSMMLIGFVGAGNAQSNTSNPESAQLNEVIIQQNRLLIPYTSQNRDVVVIDAATIKQLPVKSVNELLSYIAGIDVRQRGSWGTQGDISIDGGSFDQTLVLINGAKISDPQTGHNMMNIPIPLLAISRIEIVRGPAARAYGVNAMAGVINIITKQPISTGVSASVSVGSNFRNDDSTGKMYSGVAAETFAGLATKHTSQQIGISHANSNGYRYNTNFENTKFLYQNQIKANDKVSINLMGGYVYNDFGANGFYAAPGDKESKETVQTAIGSADASIKVTNHWTLKPRLDYRYNKDHYIYIRQKPSVYENIHETNVVDAELNNTISSNIGTFGIGASWRSENINSNSLGKESRNNIGLFGEYHYDFNNTLSINAGAYLNYNSVYGWKLFPSLDIGWNFYDHFRAFASIGTGQRLPTYTDLYYKGPANIGNPNLKPELMTQTEAGVRYIGNKLNAQIVYFYRHGSEFIDWTRSDSTQPWQPTNYSVLNTNGITLSANYIFLPNDNNIGIEGGISYTYLSPKIGTPSDGNINLISQYSINSLQHQLCVNASVTFFRHWQIALAGKYNDRLNTNTISNYKVKNYFLTDAKLSYLNENWNVYFELNNLFDVQYIETGVVPMPGRWASLGVKFDLWK